MRVIRLLSLTAILFATISVVRSQTPIETNEKSSEDATQIKQKVDKSIRKLATMYSSTKGFKNRLDESQELWNNFCQAHLSAIFPLAKKDDSHMRYGSTYESCLSGLRADMQRVRMTELVECSKPTHNDVKERDLDALKKEFAVKDKELNAMYVNVMRSKAKKIPYFKENMIKAEVAWIAFRDADADVYSMTALSAEQSRLTKLIELTKERTRQLSKWITGVEEGENCKGSYPLSK